MPRDILDQLLHDIRVKSRREERQAKLEEEAAARALKLANHRRLREAFDAERFRYWFSQQLHKGRTLDEWRELIDKQMERDGRLKG